MDPASANLTQSPTFANGFAWLFHFAGRLAFEWIPATVVVLSNTQNPPTGVGYVPAPVDGPVSPEAATQYLNTASDPGVWATFTHDWQIFTVVSLFASLLLFALTAYCLIRIRQIRRHESMRLESAQQPPPARTLPPQFVRWRRIVEGVGTEEEQSWRLSILEADIMLGELLDSLGYKGETMADKMRAVDRADFNTIDLAWEAHRARNKIAHAGLTEPLSAREARRVVGLYERVFREFKYLE